MPDRPVPRLVPRCAGPVSAPGDHQLTPAQPDQIEATVGHDTLHTILLRLVLPQTRHRGSRPTAPVLTVGGSHRREGRRHRRGEGTSRLAYAASAKKNLHCRTRSCDTKQAVHKMRYVRYATPKPLPTRPLARRADEVERAILKGETQRFPPLKK